jgi:hypothetical protein
MRAGYTENQSPWMMSVLEQRRVEPSGQPDEIFKRNLTLHFVDDLINEQISSGAGAHTIKLKRCGYADTTL